jgi:putative aldouronate transport system permease protein
MNSTSGKNSLRGIATHWRLYVLLMLPMIYLIVYSYVPMLGLQIAFKRFSPALGMWESPFVGLYHFKRFFTSYQFFRILRNTLVLSSYQILLSFPIPIIFALALNSVNHGGFKKSVQTITYMPHFISTVVLVGIITQLLNPQVGLYGTIFKYFNSGQTPADPLSVAGNFPHIYVLSGVWQQFGWDSIIYVAALTAVSPELHESAQIDGASRFQRILHIDIPSIMPTIVIMLILRTGQVMSIGFEKAFLMQNSLNLDASEIISTYVYKIGLGAKSGINNYSSAAAIGLFNSFINLILIASVNKLANKVSETSLW